MIMAQWGWMIQMMIQTNYVYFFWCRVEWKSEEPLRHCVVFLIFSLFKLGLTHCKRLRGDYVVLKIH